jgi:hypothetical protein
MKKELIRKQGRELTTVISASGSRSPRSMCGCGNCYCGESTSRSSSNERDTRNARRMIEHNPG